MRRLFNTDWSFYKGKPGTTYEDIQNQYDGFTSVVLPHDWAISKYEYFYEDATGWYRKICTFNKPSSGRVILYFDGVYMDSAVYINGTKVYEWKYGYTQFDVDITDYITDGDNEICVSVNYLNPNSRWYSGAGITRNVWIDEVPDIYIPRYGIYANAKRGDDADNWIMTVDVKAVSVNAFNDSDITENPEICLIDEDGKDVKINLIDTEVLEADDDFAYTVRNRFEVCNPNIWDIDSPYVYTIEAKIASGSCEQTEFGFRSIEVTNDKGVFLNGRHIKLNGVCEHHDFGMLGGVIYEDAMERKLINLKNMGVNSVRFAHNPMDRACMSLCDRLGMLVLSEAYDMWELSKTTYDYARFFKEWHEKDTASWVLQDRNHPSLLMWSIGNEIYDIHAGENGRRIVNELSEIVRRYDSLHNGYITFCSNYMPWENAQKAANDVEIVGYNYAERYYEEHHKAHPEWVIYGSETSSIAYSRGVYHFPLDASCLSDDDSQCSAMGNSDTSWGAKSVEECVCFDRDTEFSLGQYIWSGHDYLGEPTPYHTKNSYLGIIDTAGYPKDPYYAWKSAFTYGDKNAEPFIYITPDWDYNEGQNIDVRVYSNAYEVELILNGVSLGRKVLNHAPNSGYGIIADYKVVYEKGELKAVGYDEVGNEITSASRFSYENTHEIVCEKQEFKINNVPYEIGKYSQYGRKLEFYNITAVDVNGHPVDNASDLVQISVSGARLIALDNGDSTDYTPQTSDTKRLFKGKLLAVVECISGEEVSVLAKPCEDVVPVRRIDLTSLDGNVFDEEKTQIRVRVKLLPENATDKDIMFRVTDVFGNVSNVAKVISQEEDIVTVEAIGDGKFQLRAFSKSSSDSIRVISQLDFTADGLGEAFYNPYSFVPGSCYASVIGTVGTGNERGVSTARGEETVVIFDRIDFGSRGTSYMTIPIFSLSNEKVSIDIFDGVCGQEDAKCLCEGIYDHPMIWNVYQDETFALNTRLTGVHTISFRTKDKIHIKGFVCTKYNPAYDEMGIGITENIYGDSYTIQNDIVTGIGNNVTIDFGEVDFGDEGPSSVIICGRANGNRNTIHIRYNGPDGEVRNIMECDPTQEICESRFDISNICGKGNMQLIFLPGCDYDFKWIKFCK